MYGSGFADPPIRVPTPIEVGHKPSPIVGTMVNLKMTIVPTMHSRSHTLTCMEVALYRFLAPAWGSPCRFELGVPFFAFWKCLIGAGNTFRFALGVLFDLWWESFFDVCVSNPFHFVQGDLFDLCWVAICAGSPGRLLLGALFGSSWESFPISAVARVAHMLSIFGKTAVSDVLRNCGRSCCVHARYIR